MNAIFWCLFGTLRNVRKFGSSTGSCSVKILFEKGFVLERSKSPELFTLEYRDIIYRNKEAQEKIVELFGNQEQWISCCYLKQGSRNHFLESSSSDRLKIITDICFLKENPDDYIEKINDKIEETKNLFEIKNQILIRDLGILNLKIKETKSKHNVSNINTLVLSEQERDNIILKLSSQETLKQLEKKYQESWEGFKKKEIIKGILQERVSRFPNYKDYISLFETKSQLMTQITHINRETLDAEIWRLDSKIKKIESLTQLNPSRMMYSGQLVLEEYIEAEKKLNEKIRLSPIFQEKKILEDRRNKLRQEIYKSGAQQELEQKELEKELEKRARGKRSNC